MRAPEVTVAEVDGHRVVVVQVYDAAGSPLVHFALTDKGADALAGDLAVGARIARGETG